MFGVNVVVQTLFIWKLFVTFLTSVFLLVSIRIRKIVVDKIFGVFDLSFDIDFIGYITKIFLIIWVGP